MNEKSNNNALTVVAGVIMVLFVAWVVAQMSGARHHTGALLLVSRIGIGFAAVAIGLALSFVGFRRRKRGSPDGR